ncbi:MAG: hypothetical protein Q8L14_38915 [Myxococcales bacterium]|nr:hypothetical protein [Myxococcales bacterium]
MLDTVPELPKKLQAGWLADLDARRVVLYHSSKGDVLLPPIEQFAQVSACWTGFAVRWTDDDAGALGAYLDGDHHLFDESPTSDESAPSPHLESLLEEEAELPRLPRERSGLFDTVTMVGAFLFVVPLALLARLLSLPFRRRIRERLEAASLEERASAAASLERELAAPEAKGVTADAHFHRGLAFLKAGRWLEAEQEFDASVALFEAGETTNTVMLARALHNRSVARTLLHLPALAARDSDRARHLDASVGVTTRPRWISTLSVVARLFREFAGLTA